MLPADCADALPALFDQKLRLVGTRTDLAHDRVRSQPDDAETRAVFPTHARIIQTL
jgi:hypothetical protein